MDSLPNLSLSPPTPSPSTPTAATSSQPHHGPLMSPQNPARKKRTKAFYLQLQSPPTATTLTKPKPPARKPDPSAPKITMPCSECGRKFWSWKALYGHMRCHPNRQWRGINPPPNYRRPPEESILMSPEDHEAASCLLLLANYGEEVEAEAEPSTRLGHVGHTCGICLKVFSSGQALGGHKRCHWEKNNAGGGGTESTVSSPGGVGGGLDLNLPASQVDDEMELVLRLGF